MSRILTGADLKFIASHREEIEPYADGGVYFCFDNIENGTEAYQILYSRFSGDPDFNKMKYGWDKRDFIVYFKTRAKAKEISNQINKEVQEYRNSHPEVSDPYYEDSYSGGSGSDVSGDGVSEKKDYTTFIVIGAAAVILILLLWDRKKK